MCRLSSCAASRFLGGDFDPSAGNTGGYGARICAGRPSEIATQSCSCISSSGLLPSVRNYGFASVLASACRQGGLKASSSCTSRHSGLCTEFLGSGFCVPRLRSSLAASSARKSASERVHGVVTSRSVISFL